MDWQKILFGEEEAVFLLEVVFRTAVMFLITIFTIRLTGKRGVRQLSLFEVVMIVSLGSAAGDPMFYKEVGILAATAVFVVILVMYRIIVYIISRNQKAELVFEGKPEYVLKNGRLVTSNNEIRNIGIDEFFAELREKNVEHLGQVRSAVLETNGELSVLFKEDEEVEPGLPIWPDLYNKKSNIISAAGDYACVQCGNIETFINTAENICCSECKKCKEWVKPIMTKRIS